MAGDPAEDSWLDGPKFVAWLEQEGEFVAKDHGTNIKRRVTDWKAGGSVSVWKADELLTRLDLHLSMVPDEFWVDARQGRQAPQHHPSYPASLRREVVRRRLAGTQMSVLERETGISEGTIRNWTQKQKQKAER